MQGNEDVGDIVLGEENRRTSSQAVAARFSAALRSSAISAFSVAWIPDVAANPRNESRLPSHAIPGMAALNVQEPGCSSRLRILNRLLPKRQADHVVAIAQVERLRIDRRVGPRVLAELPARDHLHAGRLKAQ